MKTPPFLLFAALLFWGWQSGFLLTGALMGLLLESPRFIRWRWELEDSDFNRIWSFCVLLALLLWAYVFTNNEEGGGLNGLFHGDGHGNAARNVTSSVLLTSTRFLRWLPISCFAFVASQVFNVRESVPLTAVSLILGWRRRKGDQTFAGRYLNISYPYFIICLFSAGIHSNAGTLSYFWGQCVLIGWALWGLRSRRFAGRVWLYALAVAIGLGFVGQFGINKAQVYIQNFDAQWLARFLHARTDPTRSITSMGQIGDLKLSSEIVVWLEPKELGKVPTYLREASYRTYSPQGETWYVGALHHDFQGLTAEPDGTSWILLPSKTNRPPATVVNIACYLDGHSKELGAPEGLLPLPTGCRRLENTPENLVVSKNDNGAVLAAGRGVLFFDAHYAPGATIDSPPDTLATAAKTVHSTNQLDLIVPTNEIPALDQVIEEMNLPAAASLQTRLRAIDKFFLDKFTYSTWQGSDKKATTNASPLTRFLLTSRSGHCEYFATATVLLLRRLDIPARYAVGYAVHENRGTGFVVRERDAHAWCLVWDSAANTWEDFDTTPPTWVAIESKRTAYMEWFSDLKSWLRLQIASFRYRQAHLQQYILWSLIPVMVVLLYYIIFRGQGKLPAKSKAARETPVSWPGLDSEFYQLEQKIAERGLPRQPGEPLSRWLERAIADPALAGWRDPLQKLLRLHYRHRFDPQGLNAEERAELKREARACLDSLLVDRR